MEKFHLLLETIYKSQGFETKRPSPPKEARDPDDLPTVEEVMGLGARPGFVIDK